MEDWEDFEERAANSKGLDEEDAEILTDKEEDGSEYFYAADEEDLEEDVKENDVEIGSATEEEDCAIITMTNDNRQRQQ